MGLLTRAMPPAPVQLTLGEIPADCFGATANPARYVPRSDSERARRKLERLVLEEREPIALVGPNGLGKTLLLRVLARRLRRHFYPLYLPNPAMALDELCTLALGLANQKTSSNPVRRLGSVAKLLAARGRGLLLLVDDASAMPIDTAFGLASLADESEGALRLVLALGPAASTRGIVACLGPQRSVVRLAERMTLGETGNYVRERLARSVGRDAAPRVHPNAVMHLYRESRGIPRCVNIAADRALNRLMATAG